MFVLMHVGALFGQFAVKIITHYLKLNFERWLFYFVNLGECPLAFHSTTKEH